ncbi:MAG: T9SS type A sorting domain-containing protein [Carboxylicivirga sp.]|jgi:hypothetical protein|nr:T9SS type A sorting domain-containing protein [Carboxylicivirga sp.]
MKKISLVLMTVFCLIQLTGAQILNVKKVTQQQNQWCWDGCSYCILDYYGVTTSQCEIAEFARSRNLEYFGSVNCCTNPASCNKGNWLNDSEGSIEEILMHFGKLKTLPKDLYLSKEEIRTNLTCGNPFVIRWGWKRASGGGHVIVGHGIKGNTIYYMDPWYGEGKKMGSYEWMVEDTRHLWTNTLSVVDELAEEPKILLDRKRIDVRVEPQLYVECEPIDGANSYQWEVIDPGYAEVNGNGTTAEIKWKNMTDPNSLYGAGIRVGVSKGCAINASTKYLRLSVASKHWGNYPKPEKPEGKQSICQTNNIETYSTKAFDWIDQYHWTLEPFNAGVITGIGNQVEVKWSPYYYVRAKLSVAARSNYSVGEFSEPLEIEVGSGNQLETPQVPVIELNSDSEALLTVKEVEKAESYKWQIEPEKAGVITGTGSLAKIHWNSGYNSLIRIRVAAQNNCGISEFSGYLDVLSTSVKDKLKPKLEVYPNPTRGKITIESPDPIKTINIYDTMGLEVFNEQQYSRSKVCINTELMKGIYLIKIVTDETQYVKRILVIDES